MFEVPDQDHGSSWVENYAATYRYGSVWAAVIFPLFGPFGIYLARESRVAAAVGIIAEVIFISALLEWSTYRVRIGAGTLSRGSLLHTKTFALAEVDLIQHVYGTKGSQFLYVRHGDKILAKIFGKLIGFDDLVGFFREYARHHHLIFATRDAFGEWTQADASKDATPSDQQ